MTPHEPSSHPNKVLGPGQREFYLERGYLLLEKFVDPEWLERIWSVAREFIDESRSQHASDQRRIDLDPRHTAQSPRLRRLVDPEAHHELFWEFVSNGPLLDLAEDLLGTNLKFHHCKLNFKRCTARFPT